MQRVTQRVYVTRMIPQPGIELLKKEFEVDINPDDRPLTREELLNNIKGCEGVLCLLTDKIDDVLFDANPEIKGFANYAVGYDNIDVKAASARKIPISNTPGVLTDATADMAWALLFSAARRVVESDGFIRTGEWGGWGPLQYIGGDITGATLGIIGAGRIGTAMAMKSRGFGMKVLYHDALRNSVLEDKLGAIKVGFDEIIAESDYISVHVPLMAETRGLINADVFKKMKKSAYLINTSRGPVVDEAALVDSLKTGEIAGAGLDVFEKEPETAPGLTELTNVVITPHTASATIQTRNNMALKAAANLTAMLKGRRVPDCVNPEIFE